MIEHLGGTRLTHTAPILRPRLLADGLERLDRLAPALRGWSHALER